ncbi:MAG: hypothetical protein V4721_05740 [Bacteroidota bacterium]
MKEKNDRRDFIRKVSLTSLGLGLASPFTDIQAGPAKNIRSPALIPSYRQSSPSLPFIPRRTASWWVTINEVQWSQKAIRDEIKRRAAAFAEARIDTAIIFGWHIRFDFANYFGALHGYMAEVANELHKYDIKLMDHYSCNHTERPRDRAEFDKLHKGQRHHVLLFHDELARDHAQYEKHFFNDICEVDLRDGTRGYARQYQMESFCHNNPDFLDMHAKYLQRLLKEVPLDGMQVDDMCDYAGLTTCGCTHCRTRFKKDYGHEIPAFTDKNFFGDTSKPMLQWGNYQNPVFRDWIRMKTDGIVDHVKMVKSILGEKPLMSCCSSTGPVTLNAISLDLEKMAPHLDFFMLENVGTNTKGVDWVHMDAEAMNQKDVAQWRGDAVAMALSYTIYEIGGYFGWTLSRYWGVANWSSTLTKRLEKDPEDAMEQEDVISATNNWEVEHSDLDIRDGRDIVEIRLVNNKLCKDNGFKDENGIEHWSKARAWSGHFVHANIGYRFLRYEELADSVALKKDKTPIVIDGSGCISDKQFMSITSYLEKGGSAWIALPFGTHDEKGFKRTSPLSDRLLKSNYRNLTIITTSAITGNPLTDLIQRGKFTPLMRQTAGGSGWAARFRIYKNKAVIHFMNSQMEGIPHPKVKDVPGNAILSGINSKIINNELQYEIQKGAPDLAGLKLLSPEIGDEKRDIKLEKLKNGNMLLSVNLNKIMVYAVAQS